MALRIAWSRRAAQDLENIAEFIAADSPGYAAAVVRKIDIWHSSRIVAEKFLNLTMKTFANWWFTAIALFTGYTPSRSSFQP
jgi:hypothetical protein